MRRNGISVWGGALLGAALVVTGACDRGEPGASAPPREPVHVDVSVPARGAATVVHAGQVLSASDVQLATRTSGRVESVSADVGSRVAAGTPLVRLDDSGVEARVAAAEAAAERARKTFERIRNLEREGAATAQELDDARAAHRAAEAGLGEARAQRDYVVLRAPFAGTISARSVDPGDLAMPGVPVMGLLRPDSLKVVVALPGEAARGLKPGERATVRDPQTGASWPARVSAVSPARDPGSRRVRVELVPAPDGGPPFTLLPGSFVRVERSSDAPTLWLPADALVRRGQLVGTFVVTEGALELRWIRTGTVRGDDVEVLVGLTPADTVVRAPAPGLADGTPVGRVRTVPWAPEGEARL